MLWIIKWAIIFFLIFGTWFSCNYIKKLSPDEKQKLKSEITHVIDGDGQEAFKGPMIQKAKDDFIDDIKNKLKNLVNKILD